MVLQQSCGINWWAGPAQVAAQEEDRFWSFLGTAARQFDLFPLFRRKLRKCTAANVGEMYR